MPIPVESAKKVHVSVLMGVLYFPGNHPEIYVHPEAGHIHKQVLPATFWFETKRITQSLWRLLLVSLLQVKQVLAHSEIAQCAALPVPVPSVPNNATLLFDKGVNTVCSKIMTTL